jgi:hypothetical protein
MSERPRFHANDQSLDRVLFDARVVPIDDARSPNQRPTLANEGFALESCPTAVADFRDAAEVAAKHPEEIRRFIQDLTGADAVAVTGPGVLRFRRELGRGRHARQLARRATRAHRHE